MNLSISLDQITYQEMESIRKEKRQSRSEYIKEALIEAEKKYNKELEIKQWKNMTDTK